MTEVLVRAEEVVMTLWIIYDRPRDYPDKFVLRRQFVVRGIAEPVKEKNCVLADRVADLQKLIPPGLMNLVDPGDDPAILEVWV